VNAGYNMFMEFLPTNAHSLMGTIWIVIEGLTSMLATLIIWFITKNTDTLIWIGIGLNVLGTLVQFFLPESPKWLYSKKQYRKTNEVL
jgi:hypothetical protein